MSELGYLYRYEAKRYSIIIDPDMEIFATSHPRLELIEFPISHETPKGVWLGWNGQKWKWVSNTSKKRYAHKAPEDAFEAYVIRKKRFVEHSRVRLRRAKEELALADALTIVPEPKK